MVAANTEHGATATTADGKERALSIATVLASSFGLLVAVAVVAVLLIGFSTSGKNTLGLLNEKSMMIVGLIETRVRNYLDPALHQARFIDRHVEAGIVDLEDLDGLAAFLMGALSAAPQISAAAFWDTGHRRTVAYIGPDGRAGIERGVNDDRAEILAVDARAQNANGPFWDELVFDEGGWDITLVSLIQPLHHRDDYKGFVTIVVSMPDLSEFIKRVGDQFASTAYILYGEDQVLAHPNLMSRHPDLSKDNPTVRLDRVGDLVLANLWSGRRASGFDRAAAAGVDVDLVTVADNTYVAFNGRINDYGEVPWIIGAHVSADQVNVELRRLVLSGLVGVAVLVVSILAAIALGRMLGRPIRSVAVSAAQVGALDLSAVQPLPPSPIRELQNQAKAFNAMLVALRWFETYVPRSLVKQLIASGDSGQLVSAERELTILFTDIVGFTSMSEAMPAAETAAMLNEHFALLAACIEDEGGTIDKFIGDALMAFWGAPDKQADHATRACRATRAIAGAVAADNNRRRARGLAPLRLRIGIHTGPVVVGNIGAPGRINYTIVGDTVNAARRLEVLAKDLDEGADVTALVSAATVAAVDRSDFSVEPVGTFEVKGKQTLIEVFRLGTDVS